MANNQVNSSLIGDAQARASISSLTAEGGTAAIGDALRHSFAETRLIADGADMVGKVLRAPVKAFGDLESALSALRVSMTDSAGNMPAQFDEIGKQATALAARLPGSTAAFIRLAASLREQGATIATITGGALSSAARLSSVLSLNPDQAGRLMVAIGTAFHAVPDSFGRIADDLQRAHFGLGLSVSDLSSGAAGYGTSLRGLGLDDPRNLRGVLAMQGIAAGRGLDGDAFGAGLAQILEKVGAMVGSGHAGVGELRILDGMGRFAGLDALARDLGRLSPMASSRRLRLLTDLFGDDGGHVANVIAEAGPAGFQRMQTSMEGEASLDQRDSIAASTFQRKVGLLSGSAEDALAPIGGAFARTLMPVLDRLTSFVSGPMRGFLSQNHEMATIIGDVGAAGAGVLALGGAVRALGSVTSFAWEGLAQMAGWGRLLAGLLPDVAVDIGTVGEALAAIPVGPVAGAIALVAAGGVLIHSYWEPLKAFFDGFWDGLTSGMDGVLPAVAAIVEPLREMLSPVIAMIMEGIAPLAGGIADALAPLGRAVRSAVDWLGQLLVPIDAASDTTLRFGETGRACGRAVAGAFRAILPAIVRVQEAIAWVIDHVGPVVEAGGRVAKVIGNGWEETRSFLGFAGRRSNASTEQETPALPVPPLVPAMAPGRGDGGASPVLTDNRQYQITVNPAPGQDPRAISEAVGDHIQSSDRSGYLYDYAMGY